MGNWGCNPTYRGYNSIYSWLGPRVRSLICSCIVGFSMAPATLKRPAARVAPVSGNRATKKPAARKPAARKPAARKPAVARKHVAPTKKPSKNTKPRKGPSIETTIPNELVATGRWIARAEQHFELVYSNGSQNGEDIANASAEETSSVATVEVFTRFRAEEDCSDYITGWWGTCWSWSCWQRPWDWFWECKGILGILGILQLVAMIGSRINVWYIYLNLP